MYQVSVVLTPLDYPLSTVLALATTGACRLPNTSQSHVAAHPGSSAPSCNSNRPSHLSRIVPFCNNGPPSRVLNIFLLLNMLYFFLIVRLLFFYSCQHSSSAVTRFPICYLNSKHIKVPDGALKDWVHRQL